MKNVLSVELVLFKKIVIPEPVFVTFFSDKESLLSAYLTNSLTALSAMLNSSPLPILIIIFAISAFILPVKLELVDVLLLIVNVPLLNIKLLKSASNLLLILLILIASLLELLTLVINPDNVATLAVNS